MSEDDMLEDGKLNEITIIVLFHAPDGKTPL